MKAVDQRSVDVVFGTRPELIKLAPIVRELRRRTVPHRLIATGQHTDVLEPLYGTFGVEPDVRLVRASEQRASLDALLAGLLVDLDRTMTGHSAITVVQGDTTSALAGALAGFHHGSPVVHVEAGLRTHDLSSPFPEEGNRQLISRIASLHLAPTARAERALLAEGVDARTVFVTGNTVVDALLHTVARHSGRAVLPRQRRRVLVTAHRRESWGEHFTGITAGVAASARRHPSVDFIWVAHPNPQLRERVEAALGAIDNIVVLDPLPYEVMVHELSLAHVVLTDSGGLQEEAPALDKPTLVMRNTTEREEAVEAGCARLVGTAPDDIVRAVTSLLDDPVAHRAMAQAANPYGDGRAASRSVDLILDLVDQRRAPAMTSRAGAPVAR